MLRIGSFNCLHHKSAREGNINENLSAPSWKRVSLPFFIYASFQLTIKNNDSSLKLKLCTPKRHAENLTGAPEAHTWSPRACAAADDDLHAIHLILSLQQRVREANQIV